MTLRGGLIGAGYFAANHLHSWREVEGAGIVAVCDLDETKARQAASDTILPLSIMMHAR